MYYGKELNALHKEVIRMHRICNGPYKECLNLWTNRIILAAKVKCFLYFCTLFLILLAPIILYYGYNEMILLLPVEVPFLDFTTGTGFFITNLYLLLCSAMATIVLFSVDTLFLVFCFIASAHLELVRIKSQELTKELVKNSGRSNKRISHLLKSTIYAGRCADR